jgi:DNA-binding response OmpR family regulator
MSHRLLLVDDEDAILFAMTDYLARQGYLLDKARDVEEAESLLGCYSYSVAVLDVRLGKEPWGGLRLLKRIRQCYPTTRVVVLTACSDQETKDEVLSAPGDDTAVFLEKPQPLARIDQEIRCLICMRRRGRKARPQPPHADTAASN